MDDTPSDDNIFTFPSSSSDKLENIQLNLENRDHFVAIRRAVYKCMEETMENVEKNEEITGVVCLTFDTNGRMKDAMAGDINAMNLYVMLDKVKMEVMNIIQETLDE